MPDFSFSFVTNNNHKTTDMEQTTTIDNITLEDLKQEDKKQMAGIRMAIPTPLDNIIMDFQAAHKAANPDERKMTKEHIIWKMMIEGAKALQDQAEELLQEQPVSE